MRRTRLLVAIGLVTSVMFGMPAGHGQTTKGRDKPLPSSPPGRMWVVNANVREQMVPDSRHRRDMRMFLNVTIDYTQGGAPDVVLLQQVNRFSTRWLRRGFSKRVGNHFAIVEQPSRLKNSEWIDPTTSKMENGYLKRDDSAILVNTSTVRVLSRGKVSVKQRRNAATYMPIEQVVPWAKIAERGNDPGSVRLTTTSIHYPAHRAFQNRRLSHEHKARWSARLHGFLNRRMHDRGPGDGRISSLVGDFNASRCADTSESGHCRRTILWKRLNSLRYREAIHVGGYYRLKKHIIDLIFTRGHISYVDWDRASAGSYGGGSYSDHGVVTVLLEDVDRTAPTNASFSWNLRRDKSPLLFGWRGLYGGWDGGSGLKHWRIYRRPMGEKEWDLIARTRDWLYPDKEVTINEANAFQYRVTAVDRVGNRSEFQTITASK